MKHQQQLVKTERSNQSGAVRYISRTAEDGKTSLISVGISYEEAPVPTHYYVADYYQIVPEGLDVLLIFGKLDYPDVDKLRNKIEIYFPVEFFVRQLWQSSREYQKTIEEYVANKHAEPIHQSKVSAKADKVQTFHSTNVLMVLNAGHSMMDFFYISPKDLWLKPQRNEPIGMEALVRVITSAPLLLGFLQDCDQLAQELMKKFGIELENSDALVESK